MTFSFTYNYPQAARDSGFKLRNFKDGPLDWRLIGSIEIERILRDQSFEQIDAVLNHLSEAPLGSILDSNILDSGIAKYFMLSQFSVQYLLFCRKFLEETVTDLRESYSVTQMELAGVKRSFSEANNEILQLHKKITQMEAIHEVIYPCHLCTKNFMSNDALNLHISRKHNGSLAKPGKKSEISQLTNKDRENDLTLINTIKLELEIKQLKERLNNAERKIKENNFESAKKNVTKSEAEVFKAPETFSVHSIGIQSNLSEIKERDDNSEGPSTSSPNRQIICMLQEKLQEFEKWKEEQNYQNSEFLNEINNKMQDIGTALEMTRNQVELQVTHEKQKASSSVEGLEILLNNKLEEIGKTTAANLEYVVNKMETNYKDKLHQLEKELRATVNTQDESVKFVEVNVNTKDCKNEAEDLNVLQGKDAHLHKDTSVSESNLTFVKYSNISLQDKNSDIHVNPVFTSGISEDDSTDVSVSLVDEENAGKTYELIKIDTNRTHILKEKNTLLHKQPPVKPKLMPKKYARKLTNNRLSSLGVNIKATTLTPFLKKRFFDDLNERRNKLKLKHPQYNATRIKIKNFVDKLCSMKMPPNAEALLKMTTHPRPKVQTIIDDDDEYSLSGKEEADYLKASTPLNEKSTADSGNFKQRLERILASPIRKPDDHLIKAIVHREDKNIKPVPMLRKRVMFNGPEVRERHLNDSLSPNKIDKRYP